jgi:endonuclease/exonuclease/phosphatase family metal-dependent hydrolase
MSITVSTYNIHACVGMDGHFEPERIIAVLREINADVVALQEVEHHTVEGYDLLDYLAARTGLTAIAGPILLRAARHYGNALLTKLPISKVDRIDLSVPSREPRGALDVALSRNGQHLRVVATHLGLSPRERRQQILRLLALFESGGDDRYVLLGDLNEWFLWGRPLRWLRRHFTPTPQPCTYPARFPLFALDRIWVRPRAALVKLEIHCSSLARVASDHLPLKAVLENELPQRRGSTPPVTSAMAPNTSTIICHTTLRGTAKTTARRRMPIMFQGMQRGN